MLVGTLNNRRLLGDAWSTYQADLASSITSAAYWEAEYNNTQTETARTQWNFWKERVRLLQQTLSQHTPQTIYKLASRPTGWLNNQIWNNISNLNQNLQNQNNNDGPPPPDLAGIPIWGWALIVGVGVFLIWDNTKKKK